jgi:hypothetical protein
MNYPVLIAFKMYSIQKKSSRKATRFFFECGLDALPLDAFVIW